MTPVGRIAYARGSVDGRLLMGIAVTAFGVILILDRLKMLEADIVLRFWPLLLVAIGVVRLPRSWSEGGWASSFLLILVGGVMTLDRAGLVHFDSSLLVPAALLLAGAYLVLGSRSSGFTERREESGSTINALALMGGLVRRSTSTAFRNGTLIAIMGAVKLDLRNAAIPDGGAAHLEVLAFWGGIEILAPAGWQVTVRGLPLMGAIEHRRAKQPSPEPPHGKVRLVVDALAIMGGVEVVN